MNRLKCPEYIADVDKVCSLPLPWEKLANKTVVISGATGLIGTFLVDVLMRKNSRFSGVESLMLRSDPTAKLSLTPSWTIIVFV